MPTDPAPVRTAIIGYGLAGAAFHAPLIRATVGLELAAIVTRDPQRRQDAQAAHPAAVLLDSPEDLWSAATRLEIGLVIVATPNRAHVSLAQAALAAGLPVVVDKPFARTTAEGRQLIDDARRRGVLLSIYPTRRWDGDFLTVQRLLREGAFGEPLRFESRFERWRPTLTGSWRESAAPEEAGGILYDLGTHLIDQALVLFGPVTQVYAELDRRRTGIPIDDEAFLALTHASGMRSHLFMGALIAQPAARMRLLGSHAAYVKHGADVQEAALRRTGKLGPIGWGEDPEDAWGRFGLGDNVERIRTETGSYQRFYEGIVASLRTGAPPPVEPGDALAGLEIIEAARTSANERRVVLIS